MMCPIEHNVRFARASFGNRLVGQCWHRARSGIADDFTTFGSLEERRTRDHVRIAVTTYCRVGSAILRWNGQSAGGSFERTCRVASITPTTCGFAASTALRSAHARDTAPSSHVVSSAQIPVRERGLSGVRLVVRNVRERRAVALADRDVSGSAASRRRSADAEAPVPQRALVRALRQGMPY